MATKTDKTAEKPAKKKADAKAKIRKLTKVEIEKVVGGIGAVTYSRFQTNSGNFGGTCK